MAAISAAGNGNWYSVVNNAPWPGGVVPTDLVDDVTIGAFAVTITNGQAPAPRSVTLTPGTGGVKSLTIDVGGSLTFGLDASLITGLTIGAAAVSTNPALVCDGSLFANGNILQVNATVEFGGGALVEFNRAATHATLLSWQCGNAGSLANSYFYNRTSGSNLPALNNRITIQGSVAGTNANPRFISGGQVGNHFCRCAFIDINRMGTNATPVFGLLPNGSTSFNFSLTNARVTACGAIGPTGMNLGANAKFTLSFSEFSPVGTALLFSTGASSAAKGVNGIRKLLRVRTRRGFQNGSDGWEYKDIVSDLRTMGAQAPYDFVAGQKALYFEDAIWIDNSPGGLQAPIPDTGGTGFSARRCYSIGNWQSTGNSGYVSWGTSHTGAPVNTLYLMSRVLNQDAASSNIGVGDQFCARAGNPTNAQLIQIRNCMSLPALQNKAIQSGHMTSPLGNLTNYKYDVEHCTWMSTTVGETGVTAGETQTAPIGQIYNSIKSNLAWCPVGLHAYVFWRLPNAVEQTDLISAVDTDYNGIWNAGVGSAGGPSGFGATTPANPLVSSGTINAHGVSGDPQFFDTRKRDLALWASDLYGDLGTAILNVGKAIDELFKCYDPTGFDTRAEISRAISGTTDGIIDWVEDGYRVQNSAYHNTAHDGTDIGAQSFYSPQVPTAVKKYGPRFRRLK